jgi:hypothetical protein
MKKTLIVVAGIACAAALIGWGQVAISQTPAASEIYIHVDPATGCHYIVFPSGSGTVRVRPDGKPYCEAAAQ